MSTPESCPGSEVISRPTTRTPKCLSLAQVAQAPPQPAKFPPWPLNAHLSPVRLRAGPRGHEDRDPAVLGLGPKNKCSSLLPAPSRWPGLLLEMPLDFKTGCSVRPQAPGGARKQTGGAGPPARCPPPTPCHLKARAEGRASCHCPRVINCGNKEPRGASKARPSPSPALCAARKQGWTGHPHPGCCAQGSTGHTCSPREEASLVLSHR